MQAFVSVRVRVGGSWVGARPGVGRAGPGLGARLRGCGRGPRCLARIDRSRRARRPVPPMTVQVPVGLAGPSLDAGSPGRLPGPAAAAAAAPGPARPYRASLSAGCCHGSSPWRLNLVAAGPGPSINIPAVRLQHFSEPGSAGVRVRRRRRCPGPAQPPGGPVSVSARLGFKFGSPANS